MKKNFVLLAAISIIFITGFISNAKEKSNIPELLTEIITRCSTDVSYVKTCVMKSEIGGVTICKAYYKDINTYRIEIETPESVGGNFIDIVNGKKRYIYDTDTMKLESTNGLAPNLLQLIDNSKISALAADGSSCITYEFIDERGEKYCYIVNKDKKTLVMMISYDKNGKEFSRNLYSHWKFGKQPSYLFNVDLLNVKK